MKSYKFIGTLLLFASMLCCTSMYAQQSVKVQSKSDCDADVSIRFYSTTAFTYYWSPPVLLPALSAITITAPGSIPNAIPCNIIVDFTSGSNYIEQPTGNCGGSASIISDGTCFSTYSWWGGNTGFSYF